MRREANLKPHHISPTSHDNCLHFTCVCAGGGTHRTRWFTRFPYKKYCAAPPTYSSTNERRHHPRPSPPTSKLSPPQYGEKTTRSWYLIQQYIMQTILSVSSKRSVLEIFYWNQQFYVILKYYIDNWNCFEYLWNVCYIRLCVWS